MCREWKPMMWENRWNKNKTPQWKKKKKEIFFCISNSTQYIDKTNFGISFRMFYRVSTLTAPHQYGRNMAKDTHQIQFYVNGNSNNNNKIYTQVHRMNNKSYDNQNWYLLSCSWDREYEVDEPRGVFMPKIRFFRFSWFSMIILVFFILFSVAFEYRLRSKRITEITGNSGKQWKIIETVFSSEFFWRFQNLRQ